MRKGCLYGVESECMLAVKAVYTDLKGIVDVEHQVSLLEALLPVLELALKVCGGWAEHNHCNDTWLQL